MSAEDKRTVDERGWVESIRAGAEAVGVSLPEDLVAELAGTIVSWSARRTLDLEEENARLTRLLALSRGETAPTHYHTANVLAGVLERLRDAVALPGDSGAFVLRSVVEGEIEEIETLRSAHAATLPEVSRG